MDGTDFADQPALALGLDVAQILAPHHRAIIDRFLDVLADTESVPSERFARAIAPGGRDRQSVARSRVDAFRRGLSAR
jgi:predicted nucleotidyltransferase